MELVDHLLDLSGIGHHRVKLTWVSSAEGKLFADYVTQFSEQIRKLGPFDSDAYGLPLAAVERTLDLPRIRWLMGLGRQLTEQENVYHEKLNQEEYVQLLHKSVREEYEKALVLETINQGPQLVREISEKIGLPVYSVSLWLNELKKAGQAKIEGYDGLNPIFVGLAA
jgi:hypothetical protein